MTVTQNQDILVTKREKLLTIRESDWSRMKRLINNCNSDTDWWSVGASISFGVFGSAILTVLTIPIAAEESKSIKPVIWSIVVASLLIGVICVIASRSRKSSKDNDLNEVKRTFLEIEQLILVGSAN